MINSLRRWLYLTAKLLGDVNAVLRGRIARRIAYRVVGKATGRLLRRFFR